MNLEDYAKEKLWPVLVETVHALTMYPYHKAYTRDNILNGKSDITPEDLASRLGMPLGEAVVILADLKERKPDQMTNASAGLFRANSVG